MKQPAVYLLASKRNGTLYVGVTSNLIQRIWQHKNHAVEGFSKTYKVTMLVYYEQDLTMDAAITREKELKDWRRELKVQLIEASNPYWQDLYNSIL